MTEYKGYTIEKAYYGYDFYKTEEGVDCDYDGDSWRTNVKNASSLENAKAEIDDIIYEEEEEKRLDKLGEMGHLKDQETER